MSPGVTGRAGGPGGEAAAPSPPAGQAWALGRGVPSSSARGRPHQPHVRGRKEAAVGQQSRTGRLRVSARAAKEALGRGAPWAGRRLWGRGLVAVRGGGAVSERGGVWPRWLSPGWPDRTPWTGALPDPVPCPPTRTRAGPRRRPSRPRPRARPRERWSGEGAWASRPPCPPRGPDVTARPGPFSLLPRTEGTAPSSQHRDTGSRPQGLPEAHTPGRHSLRGTARPRAKAPQ